MTESPVASQTITPHSLGRSLLGARQASFHFVDQILKVEHKGRMFEVVPTSLMKSTALMGGLLFARISVQTEQGHKVFKWLRKKEAAALMQWLRAGWLAQITPSVAASAHDIRATLNQRFPRTEILLQVQQAARDAVDLFGQVPEPVWCEGIANPSVFNYLYRIAHIEDNEREKLQQHFIDKQLEEYKEFFDRVESLPLTQRQREACVIDEENNLVLAGAGTGKTSVMIGRAGYLIHSGQAQPTDILMLAFGNKAAEEMQERAKSRLGDIGIEAKTFHVVGQDIIAAVEGGKPSITPLVKDEKQVLLAKKVYQWLEKHCAEPAYQSLVNDYFQYYLCPEINPFDFEKIGDYVEYVNANNLRALNGMAVRSNGELFIANYFYRQGIEFEYEADFKFKTRTVLRRQYEPDFYLPDYDIYIEFYGIDHDGNTPKFVDREEYLKSIEWKRALHAEKGTTLIELYHYQLNDGTLENELKKALDALDVVGNPPSEASILDTLKNLGEISKLATLMKDLLLRYRANCYDPSQPEPDFSGDHSKQLQAALELLQPILQDYQKLLDDSGKIDFDDMIGKAIQYVQEGRYRARWRYILVDEFQDISEPRARLIKLLKDSNPGCSLFCVGDDWQAIYRFTGSDLNYTTQFESVFGTTRTLALDQTFRFNNSIGDVASQFVLRNPMQISKELKSLRQVDRPAVSLLRQSGRSVGDDRLEKVLERIRAVATANSSVYLLARYKKYLPGSNELKTLKYLFPELVITTDSIHASKGKEADYVVILGLETGEFGLPSGKQNNPLLEALLPPKEPYKHAEERRLFYVALTRAKHRVYLIADMTVASDFVVELLNDGYPLELNEFSTSLAQKLFQMMKCIKCETGAMVPRESNNGTFYGCNKYPLCSHMENGCPECKSQMYRKDRFRICVNPECSAKVPVCPKCGGDMKQRNGPYGVFWGCSNYRREGDSCPHKEQEIAFNVELETGH